MAIKRSFPAPLTIIMMVIVIAAIATWIIPAGSYNRLAWKENNFELEAKDGKILLPATQRTLDSLGISIRLEKFENGDIRKPVAVPGTYRHMKSNPQNLLDILEAPFKGIYDTTDIIFFILIIGSFIAVFYESGAVEKGIHYLSHKMKGKEGSLIIIFTFLFAAGGSSYGMAEEALAFYPLLVPVFLAAGYDLIMPVAVIYVGTQIGYYASTFNPFSVIIASNAAGINWTHGLTGRFIIFFLSAIISILYFLNYGKKTRRDPQHSLVLKYDGEVKVPFASIQEVSAPVLDTRTILVLALFVLTFVVMVAGVAIGGWWLLEMSVVFLASSILLALLTRMKEKLFIEKVISGAQVLVSVALIVGLARGVTVILNEGLISDSILYYSSNVVQGTPSAFFIICVFIIFLLLTIFISSSSGMAVLTMPVIGALATMQGINNEHVVNAYLFGMGIMGFITPTGLVLPSLAMVNVSYKTWIKFIVPLMLILSLLSVLYLVLGVLFFK